MPRQQQKPNLLDLRPVRVHRWELRNDELITVLVPKFQNRWLVRWILPRLSKPDFKVRLDALGSFIWQRCDGLLTVRDIAEHVGRKFGEETDPDYKRMALFFYRLANQNLIQLCDPDAPVPSTLDSER
jgi:hypothetical protein